MIAYTVNPPTAITCLDPSLTMPALGALKLHRLRVRRKSTHLRKFNCFQQAEMISKPVGMNIPVDPLREDDGVGRGNIHTYAIE